MKNRIPASRVENSRRSLSLRWRSLCRWNKSDAMYAELSQLLTRISDRFQVYTVAVIDPMTQQPVITDEPVGVSLTIPAGYDAGSTFVKEITQTADGTGVSWDDVAYRSENGKALFETDHSGLFVIIEIP